jgi:hypothetical protein
VQRHLWALRLKLGLAAQAGVPAGVVDWVEASLRREALRLARGEWCLRIGNWLRGRRRGWALARSEGSRVQWLQPVAAAVAPEVAGLTLVWNLLAKDHGMSLWSRELCWVEGLAAKCWKSEGWMLVGMKLAPRLRLQVWLRLPG